MSTLTPSLTTGLQVFNGAIPLRTSDDASDNFVNGSYSHLPIEFSATEANELKSFMLYLQSIVANGFSFPVVNESGSVIIAGPVRITGYNATLERFKVVLADADANAPAQLLLLSSLETDSTWADAETYATTQSIHPTVPNGCRYVCSIAGDSGGTEPTWTTGIGDTIVDNEVTWTCYADAVAYPAGEFTSATDTSGATIGDALYLSDTGGTTLTPPSGADKIVQEIGRVKTINNPGVIAGKICSPVGIGTSWLNAQAVTMAKLIRSVNAGAPLLGGGASADSAYGPLNLAGGANVVTGTTPIVNGGTGQPTTQLALNALAAAVTNHYVLVGDGTNVTLRALAASDLPSPSTLGAAASGANSDITSLSGLTTALSIGQGGTGQATAAAAANALLPSQSGKAGDCLTTDGTNLSWAGAAGGADVPIRAYKSTDDSKSTVAADSNLSLALVAGNKYAIDGVLFFVGGSGYLEMQWALSGIASYFMWDFNNNGGNNGSGENAGFASGAPVSSPQPALASGFYSGNGWNMPVRVAGYIEVSSNGNLQICWGASSSTIALKKGSWLRAVKIG